MDGLDRSAVHQRLAIHGLVQGVGFRPWLWQQAHRLGLNGWVRNTGSGVELQLDGAAHAIEQLVQSLGQAPCPARVEHIEHLAANAVDPAATAGNDSTEFRILPSISQPMHTTVGADLAVCQVCLAELFNAHDRRWRHPFIHCPACGPRYTLIRSMPFDRARTSMSDFAQCPSCDGEVHSPANRRFHDQTNACPQCGPRLTITDAKGQHLPGDPITLALDRIRQGQIIAIKGWGGFHLVADATQAATVARLRERKQRPAKPFAVMAANVASWRRRSNIRADEASWLERPERPIVLLKQNDEGLALMRGVSPHLNTVGAMLPYTALQHLLFHEAAGRPAGTAWLTQAQDLLLLVTSGNASGSPQVTDNKQALTQLAPLADAFLLHDQHITARQDDSVLRVREDGSACFIRRARGFAPLPMNWAPGTPESDALDTPTQPVAAVGGDLKATVCLTRQAASGHVQALVSPHVGSLTQTATRQAFQALSSSLSALFNTAPRAVACDLHPDFFSTQVAAMWAQRLGVPLVPVQHHHAHVAAVLAEHTHHAASLQPVLGLALDGHGLGQDGLAWGGELLWVHRDQCRRLGHMRQMALPGGDRASKEPWRMAAAVLHQVGLVDQIAARFAGQTQAAMMASWLDKQATLPTTSSLGRLFDAAAALLGLADVSCHEGDAAMRLESMASRAWPVDALPQASCIDLVMNQASGQSELDWRPLMHWLANQDTATEPSKACAAAVFHASLAQGLCQWARQASQATGIHTVVLTGGCMVNRLLDEALTSQLQAAGLTVWRASQYPCGDGGLSLGQAWVAHHHINRAQHTN